MKKASVILGVILGLTLLAAFLAGGYFLFEYIASLFGTLEPQLKTLAIIATIVAFFCAAIIASRLKAGGTNNISAARENLYQQLLVHWSERLKDVSGSEGCVADDEIIALEQRLALHGSSKVIAAYMNLRKSIGHEGKLGDESRELLKKLLLEMRVDIGRTEYNLNKNDLLDLLLGHHQPGLSNRQPMRHSREGRNLES